LRRAAQWLPKQLPLLYLGARHIVGRISERSERNPPYKVRVEVVPLSVDAKTVRRIAHLARIAVAEEEIEHLQGELNAILAFVEQLGEVDVANVEPMTSVSPIELKKRVDRVTDGDIAEDIVRNAPATEDHFFVVPKVVE
jgi:aspartyl-tRNA(Asn)/glutamyl-tRNA(Gln) amidotransferase subunit C